MHYLKEHVCFAQKYSRAVFIVMLMKKLVRSQDVLNAPKTQNSSSNLKMDLATLRTVIHSPLITLKTLTAIPAQKVMDHQECLHLLANFVKLKAVHPVGSQMVRMSTVLPVKTSES